MASPFASIKFEVIYCLVFLAGPLIIRNEQIRLHEKSGDYSMYDAFLHCLGTKGNCSDQ